MSILDGDGERLVTLARSAIAHELGGPVVPRPSGGVYDEPAATFVTVTRRSRLHGCIGSVEPRRPLAEDVIENAIAAAFHDPRSQPFRAEWLPEMGVEVTLLSALEPIAFTSERDAIASLRPRLDGVVVRLGRRRSTFLPQVWDSLPEPAEFLAELKMKAGLPRDFWSSDLSLSRFSVHKWGGREPVHGAPEPA